MFSKRIFLTELITLITILVAFSMITNVYGQINGKESSDTILLQIGPIQISSKIDIGMMIAAAAFVATIIYNILQIRKTERHFLEQMKKNQDQMYANEKLTMHNCGYLSEILFQNMIAFT